MKYLSFKGILGSRYVCYGNGLFVAIIPRTTGQIAVSQDGINWYRKEVSTDFSLSELKYNKDVFFIIGMSKSSNYPNDFLKVATLEVLLLARD